MTDPGPVHLAAAVVLLCGCLAMTSQVPRWWRGTSTVHPERPPTGWFYSARAWRHLARGLPLSVPMLGTAAGSLLAAPFSHAVAWALVGVAVTLTVLWLPVVAIARPRILIPPAWRPEGPQNPISTR